MQGEYGTLAHTGPLALIPLALAGLGLIYVRQPLRRWASRHPRRTT